MYLLFKYQKSRAVDQSTIQFSTILGVLLTKSHYELRRATIAMSNNQSNFMIIALFLQIPSHNRVKSIFINKDLENM